MHENHEAAPADPQKTIRGYECSKCHGTNRRLWLDPGLGRHEGTPLMCMPCAECDEAKTRPPHWTSARHKGIGDAIGRYLPAVPLETGPGYYDPHNIPKERRWWWKSLKLDPPDHQVS